MKNFWISIDGPAIGDTTVAGMRAMLATQAKYSPDQTPDFYYYSGYFSALATHAMLEKAVASGDLTRAGMRAASTAFVSPKVDGLFSDYTYGAIETRNPPRGGTVFRVNPSALIGLEVEKRNVSVPAAQSYVFEKR